MLRNITLWLLAAGLALLGVDRAIDRQLAREGTAPRAGEAHATDDGGSLPPPDGNHP
jgi:hypothetical protein